MAALQLSSRLPAPISVFRLVAGCPLLPSWSLARDDILVMLPLMCSAIFPGISRAFLWPLSKLDAKKLQSETSRLHKDHWDLQAAHQY